MHIGFLTSEYPHEELNRSGGLGTSIKNLAVRLAKCGIKVTVFAVYQQKDQVIFDESVKIISIKHKQYKIIGWYKERKRIQKIVQKEIYNSSINVIEAY